MVYAFVVNPVAGSGFAAQTMDKLKILLDQKGIKYAVYLTERPGHATEIASALSKHNVDVVVSVGGDGTACEVAAGLSGTGKTMGIIPAGTGNDFIKSAGIPNDPEKALEILLRGNIEPIDTGTVNNSFFLNVCGTGFDVTVLDYAEDEKEKHRGLTPYFLGLLKAIFHYKSVSLSLTYNDQNETGNYLICSVANGKYIGGGIPICPDADIHDGKLDLVVIQNIHRWKIPFFLPGLMMSRALHFSITRHIRVSEVKIQGEGLRFNIDGDIQSLSSAEFKINPSSLILIH